MTTTWEARSPAIECDGCAQAIKRSLGRLAGVESVDVDIEGKQVRVGYDANVTSEQAVRERLATAGFPAEA